MEHSKGRDMQRWLKAGSLIIISSLYTCQTEARNCNVFLVSGLKESPLQQKAPIETIL